MGDSEKNNAFMVASVSSACGSGIGDNLDGERLIWTILFCRSINDCTGLSLCLTERKGRLTVTQEVNFKHEYSN